MALFKINRGASYDLPDTLNDGWAYFCTDDFSFHIDYTDENGVLRRAQLNAADAETLTGAALSTVLNSSATHMEIPTSQAVLTALSSYQTKLTFDSTPNSSSSNPVTSSGVKDYVDNNVSTHNSSTSAHSDIRTEITKTQTAVDTHSANESNPHGVTYSQVGAAPTAHASSDTTYGIGTNSNYGHVKISDSTSSTSAASSGIAASPKAVKAAYDLADTANVTANLLSSEIADHQTQLDTKANKSDIATTAMQGTATGSNTYWKISNFGNWGTGNWTQKGFSMLITSRAGEIVWVSLAANDSNTSAGAIRLINRYSKIAAIHYSVSESAIYVTAAAWANNICAHILSNVNGDYVPTVASATALPSDAVAINIVEFGINSTSTVVGDNSVLLEMGGSADRPTYNGVNMALQSDVTAIDTRLSALEASVIAVLSGATEPTASLGEDGAIYLVTG